MMSLSYAKRNFFGEGWKLHLSADIRIHIEKIVVGKYTNLERTRVGFLLRSMTSSSSDGLLLLYFYLFSLQCSRSFGEKSGMI